MPGVPQEGGDRALAREALIGCRTLLRTVPWSGGNAIEATVRMLRYDMGAAAPDAEPGPCRLLPASPDRGWRLETPCATGPGRRDHGRHRDGGAMSPWGSIVDRHGQRSSPPASLVACATGRAVPLCSRFLGRRARPRAAASRIRRHWRSDLCVVVRHPRSLQLCADLRDAPQSHGRRCSRCRSSTISWPSLRRRAGSLASRLAGVLRVIRRSRLRPQRDHLFDAPTAMRPQPGPGRAQRTAPLLAPGLDLDAGT